ncbi:hypothetical protein SRHO_G00033660 [Serrasalmus rhombeus]
MASSQDRALQALSSELAQLADHRPPEEAGRAPSAEVAARSLPGSFPLGGRASFDSLNTGRRRSHASPSPTWSLGTPAPQTAFQTFTATPAGLHLLQPIRHPQLTDYAFTYASGPVARPSASVLCTGLGARVLDIAKRLPSALRRRDAFGTMVIHVGTNDISDRRSEVLKEHYQTLLDTTRKKTDARIIISGPLPTYQRGSERFSRLFALQSWLRGWCACNGLGYVETGPRFGSSQCSTVGIDFILVLWGPSSSHGTSRGPSADFKAAT